MATNARRQTRDIDLVGGAKLTKDGTTIITAAGAIVGDIQATAGSIGLSELASGITPSHIIVAAGEFTTAGGDVTETITVAGALATDLVHVTLHTKGATPVTVLTAVAISGAITVTMSADPSTDHVLTYSVMRAAA